MIRTWEESSYFEITEEIKRRNIELERNKKENKEAFKELSENVETMDLEKLKSRLNDIMFNVKYDIDTVKHIKYLEKLAVKKAKEEESESPKSLKVSI